MDRVILLSRVLAAPLIWRSHRRHPKNFPLGKYGPIYREPQFLNDTGQSFLVGLVAEPAEEPSTEESMQSRLTVEIVDHHITSTKPIALEASLDSVVSLHTRRPAVITLEQEGSPMRHLKAAPGRLHPLLIAGGSRIRLSSGTRMSVSEVEPLEQQLDTRLEKLVVLFIDGLVAPITAAPYCTASLDPFAAITRVMSGGLFLSNHWANSEWTLSSYPTVLTGEYQSSHRLFHPTTSHRLNGSSIPLTHELRQAGYLVTVIGGNPRTVPSYGVHDGANRRVFRQWMPSSDVIDHCWRAFDRFPRRHHAVFLQFMDLHHAFGHDELIVTTKDANRQVMNAEKSPLRIGSDDKIVHYLRRLDFLCSRIEDFIHSLRSRYPSSMALLLWTDHGRVEFSEAVHPLSPARTRIPFWASGSIDRVGTISDFTENVDIWDFINHAAGLKARERQVDARSFIGNAEPRSWVFSESRYPGQTYKARIRTRTQDFTLETESYVNERGFVEPRDLRVVAVDTRQEPTALSSPQIAEPSGSDLLAWVQQIAGRWPR
jgi:hypothetical protein